MDKHRLIVDSVVVRFGQKTVLSGGYITSETGMVTGAATVPANPACSGRSWAA